MNQIQATEENSALRAELARMIEMTARDETRLSRAKVANRRLRLRLQAVLDVCDALDATLDRDYFTQQVRDAALGKRESPAEAGPHPLND